jgi:hypothetical protein
MRASFTGKVGVEASKCTAIPYFHHQQVTLLIVFVVFPKQLFLDFPPIFRISLGAIRHFGKNSDFKNGNVPNGF